MQTRRRLLAACACAAALAGCAGDADGTGDDTDDPSDPSDGSDGSDDPGGSPTAPEAEFDWTERTEDGAVVLEVTHVGGDAVDAEENEVRVSPFQQVEGADSVSGVDEDGQVDPGRLEAGDSVSFRYRDGVDEGDRIVLQWSPPGEEEHYPIASHELTASPTGGSDGDGDATADDPDAPEVLWTWAETTDDGAVAVEVTHDGGDGVDTVDHHLAIRPWEGVDHGAEPVSNVDENGFVTIETVRAGDSFSVRYLEGVDAGDEVRLLWRPRTETDFAVLDTHTLSNAPGE